MGATAVLALGLALFGGHVPANAVSDIATTVVPGNGQTTSTVKFTSNDGTTINLVLLANWSAVGRGSATLDTLRVCAGIIPGAGLIRPSVVSYSSGDPVGYGSKIVPSAKCNTWTIGQRFKPYSGYVYGQLRLTWYTGGEGSANVIVQYNVA